MSKHVTEAAAEHADKWTRGRTALKEGQIVIVTFPDKSRAIVRAMVRRQGTAYVETSFGVTVDYSDFAAFAELPEAMRFLNAGTPLADTASV